jgi:4-oxalocrotonate tautomerase
LIAKLTDAVVEIEGEPLRPYTVVLLEDVRSGSWGVGGQGLTTEDVKALVAKKTA